MNLKIKNFGKITNADIKLDGITVICGNNNTGKSTVGKALFSFYNSLYDYKNKTDATADKNQTQQIHKVFCYNYYGYLPDYGCVFACCFLMKTQFSRHNLKLNFLKKIFTLIQFNQ